MLSFELFARGTEDGMSIFDLQWVEKKLYQFEASRIEPVDRRRAAVAMIARPTRADFEILFMKRADDPRDPWSGHMALPGGRVEPGEKTQAAAERETLEEVGIDLKERARFLGALDEVGAVARGRRLPMIISPFVYALRDEVSITPNHEVAKTLWVPASLLRSADTQSTMQYNHQGAVYSLPCFRVEGEVIWGLTYKMLMSFFTVVDWQLPSDRMALIAS
jgi:8-oxo-dGTP pyrophosphatase MutT (NUDIX family)